MATRPHHWLGGAVVLLLIAGLLGAAMRSDAGVPDAGIVAPELDPATTTSSTNVPAPTDPVPVGPFAPIPPTPEVRAVRTPTGLVLPVSAGSPGAWQVQTPCASSATVPGEPMPLAHIVLDPGHGGDEPGAVGPNGLTEAELNLDIARRVAERLRAQGAVVVLTRDADIRVTLSTRTAIARALDPIAFISIHHNAAPVGTSTTPGSELYHQLDDPTSKRLAGLLWEEFQAALAPFGTDWVTGDQPGARARRSLRTGSDFYGILRGALGVPTVLSEAAYLSNPAEAALLATDAFRDAEADAITRAVVRLVATDDPGSGYVATKESPTPAGGGGGSSGCVDPPLA